MFYERLLGTTIRRLGRFFPVVLLTGARQTGKTTLIRALYPDLPYVSLDLPSLAERAERAPEGFLADYPPPVVIDEVQYAPGLFRHIKRYVDAHRTEPGRFFLTGSQKFPLMQGVAESLAGRIALAELETLSLAEIQQAEGGAPPTTARLARIITRGQFPELWRQPDLPAHEYYAAYLATYLERDVRQILNVSKLRDFERCIRILAARSGQLLNKSEVARDVGVSVKAVGDWIAVLEASNQIVLLEPYFQNIAKRIIKTPKVYFTDTGLLCYLLRVTEHSLPDSPFAGQIFETFVFAELRKRNRIAAAPYNIFYYRDQRAREIDFFLERGGRISLLECKWTEFPDQNAARHIRQLAAEIEAASLPIANGPHFVVGVGAHRFPIAEGVEAIGIRNGFDALFD